MKKETDHAIGEWKREKKEVLFLPYKASMWDCFESIYKAALQDEDWVVTVMPIPYYNIGKQREILGKYYEGEDFADFAEITDYREYCISEHRPDLIFIHNPYDEYNMVTQLDETYYSSSLKKYCSHLVYIPYFVSHRQMTPELCLMPGVRNAWRIIAQNEMIRQQYIQTGGMDEERVLALGSPKFDKVLEEIEETAIPEEWGSLKGKKVFLYNTHLNGIIGQSEYFLERLERIINFFEMNQRIALLWRPHPLSIQTAKSLSPDILERYLKIIHDFQERGNGVYDTTPNLERSIALSDAYIGEEQSSVGQLYEITGKPMLYIDKYTEKSEQSTRVVRGLCGEYADGKIYMYHMENNSICVMDVRDGAVELIHGNPELEDYERNLYAQSIKYGEYIYFIPGRVNSILKYHRKSQKRVVIPFQTQNMEYNPVIIGDQLLLLPIGYSEKMPCLNLESDEIDYLPTNYRAQLNLSDAAGHSLFYGAHVISGVIFRNCMIGPFIQKYHIDGNYFEYVRVLGLDKAILTMVYDGKYFWMIPVEGSEILCWDPVKNQIINIIEMEEYTGIAGMLWASISYLDGVLYILQRNGACVVEINLETGTVSCVDCNQIPGFEMEEENREAFAVETRMDAAGNIYLFPFYANGIVALNKEGNALFYKTEVLTRDLQTQFSSHNIYNESMCTLGEFIELAGKKILDKPAAGGGTAGKQIWDKVTQELNG